MRIFLYEFVSGGGFFHPSLDTVPCGSLLTEGLAMFKAIYDDISRIDGVEVVATRDSRLPNDGKTSRCEVVNGYDLMQLSEIASASDFSLLIAPEFDSHLHRIAEHFEKDGRKLLGPNAKFIQLTSNKSATAEFLSAAGVPVPAGETIPIGETLSPSTQFPVVKKVNDGAGSMGEVVESWNSKTYEQLMRVEPFLHGTPCSQSFLCRSGAEPIACPPMEQHIANDGSLMYLGGERLSDERHAARAQEIALAAIKKLAPTIGYVGVDLILGDCEDGSDDYVLEVNPRLTTSYLGIRELSEQNVAQAMLDIAIGNEPTVSFSRKAVRFDAAGTIL